MDGTIIVIIVCGIIMIGCAVAWSYNRIIRLSEQAKNSWFDLSALLERRKKLKADKKTKELPEIDSEIITASRTYNADAKAFNLGISSFPSNLFARQLKLKRRELHHADDYNISPHA